MRQQRQRLLLPAGRKDGAAPRFEQPHQTLCRERVVFNHHDRQARQAGDRQAGRCRWGCGIGAGQRQLQRKPGALPQAGAKRERVAQQLGRALHNIQPQAETAGAVPLGVAYLIKLAEHLGLVLGRDANAAVPDFNPHVLAVARRAARQQYRAVFCVPHGIGHQIEQDALQQNRVAAHPGAGRAHPQAQAFFCRRVQQGQAGLFKNRLQRC